MTINVLSLGDDIFMTMSKLRMAPPNTTRGSRRFQDPLGRWDILGVSYGWTAPRAGAADYQLIALKALKTFRTTPINVGTAALNESRLRKFRQQNHLPSMRAPK